jgi:hypothetical protein
MAIQKNSKLIVIAIIGILTLSFLAEPARANENTKIYVVFTSSGLQNECRIYPIYHPDAKIMTNEEVLEELKERCKGVEFVVANIRDQRKVIANIREQRGSLDGVLFFGHPSDELTSIELPVIAVYPLWGQWQYPFFHGYNGYKGKKVLKSVLPVVPDKDGSVYTYRLEDIAGKIKSIQAISKMNGLRVLVVTDNPVLGDYEPTRLQTGPAREDREEYERIYLKNLEETFGTVLVTIPQKELFERINRIDQKEAEKVARKWINEAEGIKGTNEFQIIRSAKLYLSMKELMEKYNAQAITTEGYCHFQPRGEGCGNLEGMPLGIPSQGLPASQFFTDGIVATSETLIDGLITQQLGLYITGRAGFCGDYLIDPYTEIAIIGHCELPINPYGDDRKAPYIIRNLPLWEENKGGACVQVNLPIGETVTVAKISMRHKKICVFTGKTVNGEDFFKHWNDLLCRTKLAIKTNVKALSENIDWETFGNHRVAFYGDFRQIFKNLGYLIGFEVIDVDK